MYDLSYFGKITHIFSDSARGSQTFKKHWIYLYLFYLAYYYYYLQSNILIWFVCFYIGGKYNHIRLQFCDTCMEMILKRSLAIKSSVTAEKKFKTAMISPVIVLFGLLVQKNTPWSPLVISAMVFF